MELMQASNQWAHRPDDERFTSLDDMFSHFDNQRAHSRALVVSSGKVKFEPVGSDHHGLVVTGSAGVGYAPTNWAFGQLSQLAESPAGYLRTLPSEIAADCLNYKMAKRNVEDVGLLLYKNGGDPMVRAATGPKYGRIWNADVCAALINHFGDGINGTWKVPGEFGKHVDVTKANTTLFGGDRDMFVFLCDETNKTEIPNRRNGSGLMSRGFFVWNSEVGSNTFGLGTFWFDYVCCNRIVWGASGYSEIKMRHTVSAPDRFVQEIMPALETYREASDQTIVTAIKAAQAKKMTGTDLDEFLANRFGKRMVSRIKTTHELEESRPIESLWDVTTAVTALARSIPWQDDRIVLERQGGELLKLVA